MLHEALYKGANARDPVKLLAYLVKTLDTAEPAFKAHRVLRGSGDRILRQSNILGGASVPHAMRTIWNGSSIMKQHFPHRPPTFWKAQPFFKDLLAKMTKPVSEAVQSIPDKVDDIAKALPKKFDGSGQGWLGL